MEIDINLPIYGIYLCAQNDNVIIFIKIIVHHFRETYVIIYQFLLQSQYNAENVRKYYYSKITGEN